MAKIVAVARDIMSARNMLPVIKMLLGMGIEISIIAEGQAIRILEEAGLPLLAKGDDTLTSFAVSHGDVRSVIQQISQDLILVGASSPINWEQELGVCAQAMGIPVVAFGDVWGAMSRFRPPFVPDLALVIDEYEAARVVAEGRARHARVIGDIASLGGASTQPSMSEEAGRLSALNKTYSTILVVPDSTDNALEVVEFISKSIRFTTDPDSFVVIPRLIHPKLAHEPGTAAIIERANDLLSGIHVEQFDGLPTDVIAAMAGYTATCLSTPL